MRRNGELHGRAPYGEIFRGSQAVLEGLLTPRQLRRLPWLQVFRDVYLDTTELDPQRIPHDILCRAASMLLPPEAVFAGKSAAFLHGVALIETTATVEVMVPKQRRCGPKRGIAVSKGEISATDVTSCRGLATLTPRRTALEIARRLPTAEAVVVLDAMAHAGLVEQSDLRGRVNVTPSNRRGYARAERAIHLMDARAESPQESRFRVKLARHDLLPPSPQWEIYDGDGFVARVDFAWPNRKLAVEYDGIWHAEPGQQERDRLRDERLARCGWRVLHVTADLMNDDFASIVRQIEAALGGDPEC